MIGGIVVKSISSEMVTKTQETYKTQKIQKTHLTNTLPWIIIRRQCCKGDWSNGMTRVSKTFSGSSILSSPVKKLKSKMVSAFLLCKIFFARQFRKKN